MVELALVAGRQGSLRWRLFVLKSLGWLLLAKFLVRFIPLRFWRWSLGDQSGAPLAPTGPQSEIDLGHLIARGVSRAQLRLPGLTKCLPLAVATQWLCRNAASSTLVLAIHRLDRTGPHAFHAWVEVYGVMVIGACDRTQYSPVMVLRQRATPRNTSSN